jgi:hypothetical protein
MLIHHSDPRIDGIGWHVRLLLWRWHWLRRSGLRWGCARPLIPWLRISPDAILRHGRGALRWHIDARLRADQFNRVDVIEFAHQMPNS